MSPTSLLAVSLGAHLLLLAGTLWSILRPRARLWPPPGRRSWQFVATWTLFAVGTGSLVWLGVVDWNAAGVAARIRLPAGGLLLAGGLALALWGVASLGVDQALGLEGGLAAAGPYRFTRNPQYVGDIGATVGWALLTGSPRVAAVARRGAGTHSRPDRPTPFFSAPALSHRGPRAPTPSGGNQPVLTGTGTILPHTPKTGPRVPICGGTVSLPPVIPRQNTYAPDTIVTPYSTIHEARDDRLRASRRENRR